MIIGECDLPDFSTVTSFWFNPFPGLQWVWNNFSILGIGIPPAHILLQDLPMAIMCYVIAFGDIVGGTAFLEDTKRYREDEYIDVNPDRTNMCCGFRNLIEAFFSPTWHHVGSSVVRHERCPWPSVIRQAKRTCTPFGRCLYV